MGTRAVDITGQKFGKWTVIERKGSDAYRASMWKCKCDCGKESIVRGHNLRSGASFSCGCFCSEKLTEIHTTHGMHGSAEYQAWRAMIQRCKNPKTIDYHNYGGRGITVCVRWLESFENFYADMGDKPTPKHSLDRIENEGNYEPDNCRWATRIEQNNNTRRNKKGHSNAVNIEAPPNKY